MSFAAAAQANEVIAPATLPAKVAAPATAPAPPTAPAALPAKVAAPVTAPAPATLPTKVAAPAAAPAPATLPAKGAAIAAAPATLPAKGAAPETSHWLYVGAQLGDSIVGGLLGLQFAKIYSLEIRYDYVDPVIQPNNKVTASSTGAALVAMFPVKFKGVDPFFLFAKAGYERTQSKSTASDPGIPGLFPPSTSVTSTVTNRATVGAGAQYDFTNNVSGRIGINAIGSDHSVYLSAIYKF